MERPRSDDGDYIGEPANKKRRLDLENEPDLKSANPELETPESVQINNTVPSNNMNIPLYVNINSKEPVAEKTDPESNKKTFSKVLNVYKPISKTPLEVIQALQQQMPEYSQVDPDTGRQLRIGYAGRLDPMAHGVLILLMGEENKERKNYENLSKEYRFEVMFGLTTDTYDILGMIDSPSPTVDLRIEDLEKKVNDLINNHFIGQHDQPYPPYSSARVKGKFLFQWARDGKLSEIEIPVKRITIEAMQIANIYNTSVEDMEKRIIDRINGVKGDFRQIEIIEKWRQIFASVPSKDFQIQIVTIDVQVTTGTYVRSIAHELGKKLGYGAIVVDLLRTRAGNFKLEDSLRLDEGTNNTNNGRENNNSETVSNNNNNDDTVKNINNQNTTLKGTAEDEKKE